jgi:hypothetical protein
MLTQEQILKVADHLALHLPVLVKEKGKVDGRPDNRLLLYLNAADVAVILETGLRQL